MGRGKNIDTGLAFSYKVLDDDKMKMAMIIIFLLVRRKTGILMLDWLSLRWSPRIRIMTMIIRIIFVMVRRKKVILMLALSDKLPSSQQKLGCDPIYQKPVMTIHIWCL